jgi:hypothetical protein
MPDVPEYNIFISHAWKYGDFYDRLVGILDGAAGFHYKNHSTTQDKPTENPNTDAGERANLATIEQKIQAVDGVVILAGMYIPNKYWMQKELELAIKNKKPIIGIIPWGQERIPIEVQKGANEMVGWSEASITNAIRKYFV